MNAIPPPERYAQDKARLHMLRLLDEEENEIIDEMWSDQEKALRELWHQLEKLDIKMRKPPS